MPSSDLFVSGAEDNTEQSDDLLPPPSYDNVELNINGSLVENVHHEEDSDDIFIPAAASAELPPAIPPSYSEIPTARDMNGSGSVSQPSEASIPAAPVAPLKSPSRLSSLFGKSSSSKPTKNQMNNAVELTKFALAALQKGDGELGRQRLEQALGVLGK